MFSTAHRGWRCETRLVRGPTTDSYSLRPLFRGPCTRTRCWSRGLGKNTERSEPRKRRTLDGSEPGQCQWGKQAGQCAHSKTWTDKTLGHPLDTWCVKWRWMEADGYPCRRSNTFDGSDRTVGCATASWRVQPLTRGQKIKFIRQSQPLCLLSFDPQSVFFTRSSINGTYVEILSVTPKDNERGNHLTYSCYWNG